MNPLPDAADSERADVRWGLGVADAEYIDRRGLDCLGEWDGEIERRSEAGEMGNGKSLGLVFSLVGRMPVEDE